MKMQYIILKDSNQMKYHRPASLSHNLNVLS